jgi:hypothetical protein
MLAQVPVKPSWGRFRADAARIGLPGKPAYTPSRDHIVDVAAALRDAWAMVPVDFFVGEVSAWGT